MLVLSREKDEAIVVGRGDEEALIRVVDIRGNKVRLGIEAAKYVPVWREELLDRHEAAKQEPGDYDMHVSAIDKLLGRVVYYVAGDGGVRQGRMRGMEDSTHKVAVEYGRAVEYVEPCRVKKTLREALLLALALDDYGQIQSLALRPTAWCAHSEDVVVRHRANRPCPLCAATKPAKLAGEWTPTDRAIDEARERKHFPCEQAEG
jgi:carbon storage regulator